MSARGTEPNMEPLLFPDPVIEAYLKDVDRTLIREQLRKTPAERVDALQAMAEFYDEARQMRAREREAYESVDKLIELKRAAGRPKDFEIIAELEAIRQEIEKLKTGRGVEK